ncbi:MAG: 1-phosphofructokinase [Cyanobacteria bacterium P01_D01_bin.6]
MIPTRIATVTLNPAIDQTVAIANFQPNAVNRVSWEQADAGGKGVNVAAFLADYGCQVSATGFLGQDNPELFERLFYHKQIDDRFIRIPGKTRVNIKIVDDVQGQVTDINFPGQAEHPGDLNKLESAIASLAQSHQWFIFSGSIPEGLPTTIYHDLIEPLKDRDIPVVIDTSGAALRHALSAKPYLIKPNLAELRELTDQPLDTEAAIVTAAWQLVNVGIHAVVVSMGADGALFINKHTTIQARSPQIVVKSTVGAGDALVAGLVAGLSRGNSWADCAALATAFAIAALSQIGAGLPSRDVVDQNCDRVTLRFLD